MDRDSANTVTEGQAHGRNHLLLAGHFTIMAAVVTVVALTAYHPACGGLLRRVTGENGFVEWGSVVILVSLSVYACMIFVRTFRNDTSRESLPRLIGFFVSLGALLAALEEISWGQHILSFPSGDLFTRYNMQGETNIHNLLPATLFNALIFAFIYVCFICIPALCRLFPAAVPERAWKFLPATHTMLIFAFASSLQAYFSQGITYLDTAALWCGLILLAVILWKGKIPSSQGETLHLAMVIACTLFFMMNHSIFSYNNMQYEIREAITAYGILVWFHEWTDCQVLTVRPR